MTTDLRKDELEDQIETIEDLVEEALDPELTREELVAKVKEIKDTIEGATETADRRQSGSAIRTMTSKVHSGSIITLCGIRRRHFGNSL